MKKRILILATSVLVIGGIVGGASVAIAAENTEANESAELPTLEQLTPEQQAELQKLANALGTTPQAVLDESAGVLEEVTIAVIDAIADELSKSVQESLDGFWDKFGEALSAEPEAGKVQNPEPKADFKWISIDQLTPEVRTELEELAASLGLTPEFTLEIFGELFKVSFIDPLETVTDVVGAVLNKGVGVLDAVSESSPASDEFMPPSDNDTDIPTPSR